jgi:hypothetical protein
MILNHPVTNQEAIEKYKDRMVIVEHGLNLLWLSLAGWVNKQDQAMHMKFSDALKHMENYKQSSMIKYHFVDLAFGSKPLAVSEYKPEDVINCPLAKFDDLENRRYKSTRT